MCIFLSNLCKFWSNYTNFSVVQFFIFVTSVQIWTIGVSSSFRIKRSDRIRQKTTEINFGELSLRLPVFLSNFFDCSEINGHSSLWSMKKVIVIFSIILQKIKIIFPIVLKGRSSFSIGVLIKLEAALFF